MLLGLVLQLWCLLVVVNVASTAKTFSFGDESFSWFPTHMTWPEAKLHCVSEGLQLAIPGDNIAVGLRKHMVANHIGTDVVAPDGSCAGTGGFVWVSGRGDGVRAVRWTTPFYDVTPLGRPVRPDLIDKWSVDYWASHYCMFLDVFRHDATHMPNRPYSTVKCSDKYTVLCQEGNIKKIEVFNIIYQTNSASVLSRPASTTVTTITNHSNLTQEADRVLSFSYTTSKNWGNSAGGKFNVETTVSAGIPFVAMGEVKIGFEGSYSHTWGGTNTTTNTDQANAKIKVPAHSQMSVWVTYKKNKIDIDYTSDMKIYYDDGTSKIREGEPGVFKGVSAAEFDVIYGKPELLSFF